MVIRPSRFEDLALLFTPLPEEERENDPDQCGFYLLPYAVFNQVASTFGTAWASDLDIRWGEYLT